MPTYLVGNCWNKIRIEEDWRVLDVGSGQSPHPRANVLLEKYVDDDRHRSGDGAIRDSRLIVGDACAMPFEDGEFDYVIASHIAEHVEDPSAFCREITRVATAGYVETPGWLGDMLLRESFHAWRVRRKGDGLEFRRVVNPRPLGWLADVFYALVYAGVKRDDHWTPRSDHPLVRTLLRLISRMMGKLITSRPLLDRMYTRFEWAGTFPVTVKG